MEEGKCFSSCGLEDLLALAFTHHCILGTLNSGCDSQLDSPSFVSLQLEHGML